ncbi:replication initiation protein [Neobacillus niacini]|nr:replication initiation protein [Neobacillus niacini]MEC1524455.1 replication initiation protein [Neobacillus niacini]
MATTIIEARKNHLVTKSNMLIEANYKLGVVEQKIILCLASNIQPTDSDFKTYNLPIKEFNKLLGLKGSPKYSELRQITKEMMQKVFEVRINKKVIQVAWLSYVAYNESEGTIDIRFDPFLRPYLLELKKNFTSYKLENVVKLKSTYAIRIYELLKQYEKLRERTFLLVDLRKMLGAEDVYPAYGNFKQRVLVPAQKELKQKTDINFEIEEIKVGRRVEKLKFIIISGQKKSEIKQLEFFGGDLEEFQSPNTYLNTVKRHGVHLGLQIDDDTIKSWEKYGQTRVIDLMEQMLTRTDIDNPIGYITTVLKASKVEQEVTARSDTSSILLYLVSKLRKSKESKQSWLIRDLAIEELQATFNMNLDEASSKYEEIKKDLFEALGVNEPVKQFSEEELEQKKQRFEAFLQSRRS